MNAKKQKHTPHPQSSRETSPKIILIVAGGTGGHISPGVALAEELESRNTGVVAAILSLKKNVGNPDFQARGRRTFFYSAPPFSRKTIAMLAFPFRMLGAMFYALHLLRRLRPVAVVGMGGYSTFPALFVGGLLRIPLFVCEQNAYPGKMTLFFSRKAHRVFLSHPDSSGQLQVDDSGQVILSGNPLRKRLERLAKKLRENDFDPSTIVEQDNNEDGPGAKPGPDESSRDFSQLRSISGSSHPLKVLVLGGSQGARQLNEMVILSMHRLPDCVWQLQAGQANIQEVKEILAEASHNYCIEAFDFDREIHRRYMHADAIVCRAGAGVLTEASAFGKPMLLIPYPYAADGHQKHNALVYVDGGAAEMIDTKEVDADALVQKLEILQSDPVYLDKMGKNSAGLTRLNAAKDIIDTILADTGN